MPINKVLVAVVVAGATAIALSGGDANASGPRDPWTKPIAPPETPDEVLAAKQTICACFRGGARELRELAACALKQVYGDESWEQLMDPVDGDDPSLAHVVGVFLQMANALISMPESQHAAWCGDDEPDPVIPGVIVDPPPPPPPGNDPSDISKNVGTKAGQLIRIKNGDSPAAIIARAHGVPQNSKNVERGLWSYNLTGFNLYFYSRPLEAQGYGSVRINGKWYDVAPAMYPWNQNLIVAAAQHEKPMRQVTWEGKKIKTLGYGMPYVAPMKMVDGQLVAPGGATYEAAWSPERNPPQSVLDALQLDLQSMREVWEANNF